MLPYTGTYAALGVAIENGFRLYVGEQGGKLGGGELAVGKAGDESDPRKATANVNKPTKRDNARGNGRTLHSRLRFAMATAAKDNGPVRIVPHARAHAGPGGVCPNHIFRSSFSNWQPAYAMGEVAAKRGARTAVTRSWKYPAGDESVKGCRQAFEKGG